MLYPYQESQFFLHIDMKKEEAQFIIEHNKKTEICKGKVRNNFVEKYIVSMQNKYVRYLSNVRFS